MSLITHTGTMITTFELSDWMAFARECGALLIAYASMALRQETRETDAYSAVYSAGYGRDIRLAVTVNEGNPVVTISEGYWQNGYVPLTTQSLEIVGNSVSAQPRMRVINKGDAWALDFEAFKNSSNQPQYMHLRGVKLRSSIDGRIRLSLGVYAGASSVSNQPYPDMDTILEDGQEYALSCTYSNYLRFSVPTGQIMLYPSLITAPVANAMGVPTIGKQTVYMMSHEYAYSLGPYVEFYVGPEKFVSLGHVAILSQAGG